MPPARLVLLLAVPVFDPCRGCTLLVSGARHWLTKPTSCKAAVAANKTLTSLNWQLPLLHATSGAAAERMCALLQVTGTRRWLRKLGLPVKLQWRPWKSATGQVGGYYEVYDGLTFATVRDAGHMVHLPQFPQTLGCCLWKRL